MRKFANNIATRPIVFVVICTGMLGIISALNTALLKAGIRNLAFVNLSKLLSQPTLTLDGSFTHSLKLFERVSIYDPARYDPYRLRLKGLTETFGEDDIKGDSEERQPAGLHAPMGEREISRVRSYLRTVAHSPTEFRAEAIQQLTSLLDTYRESDDFGRYTYTDADSSFFLFPVVFDRCPKLELMAVYFSEHHIAVRRSVSIVIVWRVTDEISWEQIVFFVQLQQNYGWGIHRDRDYLIQVGNAVNQLFDGGFEQTVLPREGWPSLLPRALYSRQTQQHTRLLYEIPESGQNMILELDGKGEIPVGLGSLPLEIPAEFAGQAYLITGRYRTEGEAAPRIGLRWLLKGAKKWDDNISSYVVRTANDEWTSFAGILLPHPEAESFQYWVLNASADSRLYVDSLGIFSIFLPCVPK